MGSLRVASARQPDVLINAGCKYTIRSDRFANNNAPNNISLQEKYFAFASGHKKSPVKGRGNLMFSQRNNPYCELLQLVMQIYVMISLSPKETSTFSFPLIKIRIFEKVTRKLIL